jgi:hypothetical protein
MRRALESASREQVLERVLIALSDDAAQDRLRHDLLGELLDELDAEYGPVPPEIREQTRLMWPDETP